ncbi:hypothetical protein BG004_001646 [Podila humilis]|nr:hypothetical protein BG004_001646 [Podila humilis]
MSLTLFCLVDGDATSNAFPVQVDSTKTVDYLKDVIKTERNSAFSDVAADNLKLWRAFIPNGSLYSTITIDALDDKTELANPSTELRILFPESPGDYTYIIVQRPSQDVVMKRQLDQDPHYSPQKKKTRIAEEWRPFTASDGGQVELPASWIDFLANTEFAPEPRAAFAHLRNNLRPGNAITILRMGQSPNYFEIHGLGQTLFVTEQMLELWKDISGDKGKTYKRILSGPRGIGKSYLSHFLAARAYAEGWLMLYIEDAGVLNSRTEVMSSQSVVQRFLAFNKDILTTAELRKLVDGYDGTINISTHAISRIFEDFLKSTRRKTLLLVDEHWKLFEKSPFVPDKFVSLGPLSRLDWWGEHNAGTRLILSGTAYAKFEMTLLSESSRSESVIFVGPLSRIVFSKLLDTCSRLAAPAVRTEAMAITNCVPGELVKLVAFLRPLPDPISMDTLESWRKRQICNYYEIVALYHKSCTRFKKARFYTALLQTSLGSNISSADVDGDFMDLGLVYRSKDFIQGGAQHHVLCHPAWMALREQLKMFPFPAITKKQLVDGTLSDDQFKIALSHNLIIAGKPIELYATDINNKNRTVISLDFTHCETLKTDMDTPRLGHEKVLTFGYKGYPRFHFMLGRTFFQVSVNDFASHNTDSANISWAFNDRDSGGMNQIERYLDHTFGPGHSAAINNSNNKFSVTKNGVPVPGFQIVYICGSRGKPRHRTLVEWFPEVLHVCFDELKDTFLQNSQIFKQSQALTNSDINHLSIANMENVMHTSSQAAEPWKFILVNCHEGRKVLSRFTQPTRHVELMSVIVEAFERAGVRVIFAERNDSITVIVVETSIPEWSEIAHTARFAYMSEVTQLNP